MLDRQDPSKNSWADFEPVPDAAGYYMTEIPADASMVRMYLTAWPTADGGNCAHVVTSYPETYYNVNVAESIENGTVTFEATSKTDSKGYVTVAVGDEVTVTATPDPGFELSGITVTGVNTDIAVIVNDGKFIMPEDAVTINAIFTTVDAIIGVKDGVRVSTVKYVKNGKLVIATPEGTFSGTGKRVK